jgi:D-arabinose 1-dehydrogenase-like Zn-dependent alcohol dehydrogenase
MYAMQLTRPGSPLKGVDIPIPKPNKNEILIKVTACGICRTDLYGEKFLALAPNIPIKTEVHIYPLIKVNEALDDLRHGRFTGAAVIQVETIAAPIHT